MGLRKFTLDPVMIFFFSFQKKSVGSSAFQKKFTMTGSDQYLKFFGHFLKKNTTSGSSPEPNGQDYYFQNEFTTIPFCLHYTPLAHQMNC